MPRVKRDPAQTYRGDEQGQTGGLSLTQLNDLLLSPDYEIIPDSIISVAGITYTMPVVPVGKVRLIISAVCRDDAAAAAEAGITLIDERGAGNEYDTVLAISEGISATRAVAKLDRPVVIRAGGTLRLDASTALGMGGIVYIDAVVA
jgi:hypothetical protein